MCVAEHDMKGVVRAEHLERLVTFSQTCTTAVPARRLANQFFTENQRQRVVLGRVSRRQVRVRGPAVSVRRWMAAEVANDVEQRVLHLLRSRNRAVAPALAATRAAEALQEECNSLEAKCDKMQQRADLLEKEKHTMSDDLELLQQNEANAGVSREHVRWQPVERSCTSPPDLHAPCACRSNSFVTCSRRARRRPLSWRARQPRRARAMPTHPRRRG